MSQPMNRRSRLPALGKIDEEAGEFWAENPFLMMSRGDNLSAFERNRLFMNQGGSRFLDASFASGADIDADSRSVIAADIDLDGGVDLLVGSAGGGPLRLFANRCAEGHAFALLHLKGVKSNSFGVGSRVVLECGGRKIVRDVFPVNGFMGQGPAVLHVGLGEVSAIDRLTVRWPTGRTDAYTDIPINKRVTLTEGDATFRISGLRPSKGP